MCQRVKATEANPCRQCAQRLLNHENEVASVTPAHPSCPLSRIDWEAVRARRAQRLARKDGK